MERGYEQAELQYPCRRRRYSADFKENDKVENRESIGTGIQKLLEDLGNMEMQIELIFLKWFIHQRYLQIPMSGVQMELQLKEIIFRM